MKFLVLSILLLALVPVSSAESLHLYLHHCFHPLYRNGARQVTCYRKLKSDNINTNFSTKISYSGIKNPYPRFCKQRRLLTEVLRYSTPMRTRFSYAVEKAKKSCRPELRPWHNPHTLE
ncbi:hypothetical protein X975_08414, partial [Stegodyphus mimosarum]